jgi:hypothetical protein
MTESAVAVKLPTFWPSQPRAWFVQAEAQFTIRGITQDATKYAYLVAALDQHTAERLIDALENPPDSRRYDSLKERLLSAFSLSLRERAQRLLSMRGLGDRRPSELMDEMLALLGDHPPCLLFMELFHQQLPADVRLALASCTETDARELARRADTLWASRVAPAVAVVSAEISDNVHAVRRSDAASTVPSPKSLTAGLCFYHKKFGAKAQRCRAPCSFSGNGPAGRQ